MTMQQKHGRERLGADCGPEVARASRARHARAFAGVCLFALACLLNAVLFGAMAHAASADQVTLEAQPLQDGSLSSGEGADGGLSAQAMRDYFGHAWDELAFVDHDGDGLGDDGQPAITVSERKRRTASFAAPATYAGRYFSNASVTGAAIATPYEVDINVPANVLNMSAARASQVCASGSPALQYFDQYGQSALNWAVIQSCLDYARKGYRSDTLYRIVLPKGTFAFGGQGSSVAKDLKECLHIHSNTWLDMTAGTTLVHKSRSVCALRNGYAKTPASGYADSNIIVEGGTWVGLSSSTSGHDELAFNHARNVVVRNAVFDGCYGAHHVELVGVSDATVHGCQFKGYRGSSAKECIQLEIAGSASASSFPAHDYTVTRNVVIYGNTFRDASRGVGTHYAYLGYANSDVLVERNTFANLHDEALMLVGFKNVAVRNNVISGCDEGMRITPVINSSSMYSKTSVPYTPCGNYLIEGNSINLAGGSSESNSAFIVYGNKVGSTTYALCNVMLRDNSVNASWRVAIVSEASNVRMIGGAYSAAGSDCLLLRHGAQVGAEGVGVASARGTGIAIESGSALSLAGSRVTGCGANGVSVGSGSVLSATGSEFSGNGQSGIDGYESTVTLGKCKVGGNGRFGVHVEDSRLTSKGDTFKSNGLDGLGAVGSKLSVSKANASSNGRNGASVSGKTSTFSKCTFSKNGKHGMQLSKKAKATLKKCKLKSNRKCGLRATGKTKLQKLSKNAFSKNGKYGIHLSGGSKALKRSGNKMSKNGKGPSKGY